MNDGRLLLLVLMLIALAAIAAWVLLRTGKEDKELAQRLAEVSAIGRPKVQVAAPSITRRDTGDRTSLKESLAGLFGFSFKRTDQYKLGWPWVVILSLIAGRIAVLLASGVFGWFAWVLMPVGTLMVSRSMFKSMEAKRTGRLRSQFPDAIGLIVRAVRVGVPVSSALRAVGRDSMMPTSTEFERLADEISIGKALDVALRDMATRNNLPEYGFFAAALSLQAQTGGGLAETLELLADVTRKRLAMQARGHALSSEARTSSYILGALPIVSSAGIYVVDPNYLAVLVTEEVGRMILGLAVLSLLMGMFSMRMIIRSALAV
jgi:tight adherence protein B